MKNAILILILTVLFSGSVKSQNDMRVIGFIETGYLSQTLSTNENTVIQSVEFPNAFYADIFLDFSIKNFHFEQQIYNIFTYPGEGYTFMPYEIRFTSKLYYKFKNFTIGVDHMCLHPIIISHNEDARVTRRDSHDKIFIRYTFGVN